jgi:hypothetical protein
MNEKMLNASPIKTLRISLRPGASAVTQLATALMKRDRTCAERISVASFFPRLPVPIRVPVEAGPRRSR